MRRRVLPMAAALAAAIAAASAVAGPKDPIEGPRFERMMRDQQLEFQAFLSGYLPDSLGCLVVGPLYPYLHETDDPVERAAREAARSFRVICRDLDAYRRVLDIIPTIPRFSDMRESGGDVRRYPGAIRGSWVSLSWGTVGYRVLVTTYQQHRWLIWRRDVDIAVPGEFPEKNIDSLAAELADYLWVYESGGHASADVKVPSAAAFGLPPEFDLYPPRPDYVIDGYQNYKDFLYDHADIETWFADGILAFIPSDSLMEMLKSSAPAAAWPNKEAPLLQHEFRKYFDRGGDLIEITTLTKSSLEQLDEGEYFYAVGLNGKIRFAFETPREEVERIERESGRKLPRANHAFLFPGEPVLTAGAFFVERDPEPRIVAVNTLSGHYFYSNVTGTIRDDISIRSDRYLLTIGHFFNALDREGISYADVLISKM